MTDNELNLKVRKNGEVTSCISNYIKILSDHPDWKGRIGLDEFSSSVRKLDGFTLGEPGAWTDIDCTRTMIWLNQNYGISASDAVVSRVIDVVADNNRFHPVVDYLKSLRWDGVHRVDSWLEDYFGAIEHPATFIFQRVALIGAVARVMEPGCKNDNVLILEGKQGIGKSSGICALFGADWFSDTPLDIGSKDAYLCMRGNWGIEIPELAVMDRSRKSSSELKAFISQLRDEYRPPYARNVVTIPRQCVFIGTVNYSPYLTDSTGNRRFMPVEVFDVDVDGIAEVRDQLWAEAYHLYCNNESWWFDSDNESVLSAQETRFEYDPWEEPIQGYIIGLPVTTDRIHSDELYEALGLDVSNIRRSEFSRIRSIMERLGWKNSRPYINGVQLRGFVKINPDFPDDALNEVTDLF